MAVAVKTGDYKTSLINNRRYLGNKYKLLPFITKVVNGSVLILILLLIYLQEQVQYLLLLQKNC